MNNQPLVTLRHLSKCYRLQGRSTSVLDDVSLQVNRGDIVGILGPNGSGKTTIIKIIAGLCTPNAGTVEWDDARPGRVGMLLDGRANMMERLSTRENAKYYCTLRGCRFENSAFDALCSKLSITNVDTPLQKLSTGNKIRSALLLAVVHRPQLVLLDEPSNGLDASGIRQLETLIVSLADNGCTFIICSHDLEFIDRVSRTIVCLHRGKIIYHGDKDQFQRIRFRYKVQLEQVTGNSVHWMPDHQALCHFIFGHAQAVAAARSLDITRISLADQYQALLNQGPPHDPRPVVE